MHQRGRGQLIPAIRVRLALPDITVRPQRVLVQRLPVSSVPREMGSGVDGTPADNRAGVTQGSASNPIYIRE